MSKNKREQLNVVFKQGTSDLSADESKWLSLRKHWWAIGLISLLALGAAGATLKYLEDSAKRQKAVLALPADRQKSGSYLSALNPFVSPPNPTSTPQLSKEYIYAGSRMLAVEDANASAAPPADLAVWRPSTGVWWVMGGQGSTPTNVAWGLNGDVPVPGDFDGDGKTDFSVYRPSTGYWYVSNSSNGYTIELPFGLSSDKTAQADYDGDGRTDMALFRPSTRYWYLVRSSDSVMVSYEFGLGTDTPAPADYDGDGKADYAVWRGSSKTFYVKRSSNNHLQVINLPNPATDGAPVCGDYDGDGKADAAIKSSVTGNNNWYILPSAGGAMQTIPWYAGDREVHNDYDGDGKVDIAVWRADIGWWFIRQSSLNGQLREAQWGGTFNGVPDIPVPAFYRR